MRKFPAADLSRNTGDLLDAARNAPVAITKHSKPRFVIMSVDRYQAMADGLKEQVSFDVSNPPAHLGALLDRGIEDALNND